MLRRKGSGAVRKNVLLYMNRVVRNYIEEKEGCRRAFSSGKKYRSVEKMPARHAEKCGGSKAPSLRGVHLIEWKTLSFSGFSEEKDRSTFVRLLGKYLLDKLLTVVAHRKSRISEPRGVFLSFFFFFVFFSVSFTLFYTFLFVSSPDE